MTDNRDIPPAAGQRPPFDSAGKRADAPPSDDGTFGETYDSAEQKTWRDRQESREVAPEGVAEGRGMGAGGGQDGEDYDSDPATGGTDDTVP